MNLGRVEIPAERAGDQAAEQNAKRIQPPALQLSPLAADHASCVESEIDAAVAERADRSHREKARAAVVGSKIGAIGEREAEPGDKPAHGPTWITVGGAQPSEERGRPIRAADNRLPERKKERAEKRANKQRAAVKNRRRAGRAQDESRYEN